MAGGHLGKADFTGEGGHLLFVVRDRIGVHEDDGDGADAVIIGGLKRLAGTL